MNAHVQNIMIIFFIALVIIVSIVTYFLTKRRPKHFLIINAAFNAIGMYLFLAVYGYFLDINDPILVVSSALATFFLTYFFFKGTLQAKEEELQKRIAEETKNKEQQDDHQDIHKD